MFFTVKLVEYIFDFSTSRKPCFTIQLVVSILYSLTSLNIHFY